MCAEKNLKVLKEILLDLPDNVCLAFVGDGPEKAELERHFKGLRVVFTVGTRGASLGKNGQSTPVF